MTVEPYRRELRASFVRMGTLGMGILAAGTWLIRAWGEAGRGWDLDIGVPVLLFLGIIVAEEAGGRRRRAARAQRLPADATVVRPAGIPWSGLDAATVVLVAALCLLLNVLLLDGGPPEFVPAFAASRWIGRAVALLSEDVRLGMLERRTGEVFYRGTEEGAKAGRGGADRKRPVFLGPHREAMGLPS